MIAINKASPAYEEYEGLKNENKLPSSIVRFVDGLSLSNRYIDWSYISSHSLYGLKNGSVFSVQTSDNPANGEKTTLKNGVRVYMTLFGVLSPGENVNLKKRVKTSIKSDSKDVLTSTELYNRIGLLRWAEKCGLTLGSDSLFMLSGSGSGGSGSGGSGSDSGGKSFFLILLAVLLLVYRLVKK